MKIKNKKNLLTFNRERLLLTALIAVAFLGFLLWSIEQVKTEEEQLLSSILEASNPAENKIIKITSPKINEAIKSPLMLSGQAAPFNGALQVRLKDASGLILAQKQIMSKSGQRIAPFTSVIIFKKPTRAKGAVEIFTRPPNESMEANKLIIPVSFKN